MSAPTRPAVVLFRGDPPRDEQEKRLPRGLLTTLHRALLRRLRSLAVDIYIAGQDGRSFRLEGPAGDAAWPIEPLGRRIETALRFCFDSGYRRVLVLAGDIMAPEADDLQRAIDALCDERRTGVIGASGDGGFYVAGFNVEPAVDWDSVVADRGRAAQELIEQLVRDGFAMAALPPADDIDTIEDARRAARLRVFSRRALRLAHQIVCSLARALFVPQETVAPKAITSLGCFLRAPPR